MANIAAHDRLYRATRAASRNLGYAHVPTGRGTSLYNDPRAEMRKSPSGKSLAALQRRALGLPHIEAIFLKACQLRSH
jgi:hypothetical protein